MCGNLATDAAGRGICADIAVEVEMDRKIIVDAYSEVACPHCGKSLAEATESPDYR